MTLKKERKKAHNVLDIDGSIAIALWANCEAYFSSNNKIATSFIMIMGDNIVDHMQYFGLSIMRLKINRRVEY